MSLTSHLKDTHSPIRAFLRDRFPNTREVVKDCRSRLVGIETILPPASAARYPYDLIGMAIDYRLRFYFAETPLRDLVAYRGLADVEMVGCRLSLASADDQIAMLKRGVGIVDLGDFVLERVPLADLSPVQCRLARSAEELLARYCIVLSLYEMIFRSGGRVPEALRLQSTTSPFVPTPIDDLLAIPQPHWLDDLCTLSWAFYDDNTDLLERPVILNPTFDGSASVGGADADMIVDDCLVDVKLTIDSGLRKLGDWLYQLLGYTLLDYSDTYGIRSVALYLPRQRAWFRWSIEDLIDKLSDHDSSIPSQSNDETGTALGNLRAEFRRVVEPSSVRSKTAAKSRKS